MEETRLFALPEGIAVDQIQITKQGLLIEVVATAPTARCQACSEVSSSVHCHYRRPLRDVPCADRFHIVKNLTEVTQLLLAARCQAAILEASKTDGPPQDDPSKPVIALEEWRPKEPAYVEKA